MSTGHSHFVARTFVSPEDSVDLLNVDDAGSFIRAQVGDSEVFEIHFIPHDSAQAEVVFAGEEGLYPTYAWLGETTLYFSEGFDDLVYRSPRGSSVSESFMAQTSGDASRENVVLVGDKVLYAHANELRWVAPEGAAVGTTLAAFPDDLRSMAFIDGLLILEADGALYHLVLPADFE